jgi:flagellar motility protein MotE (MotC chaperone)
MPENQPESGVDVAPHPEAPAPGDARLITWEQLQELYRLSDRGRRIDRDIAELAEAQQSKLQTLKGERATVTARLKELQELARREADRVRGTAEMPQRLQPRITRMNTDQKEGAEPHGSTADCADERGSERRT